MSRKIYAGLIAFPILMLNAGEGLASFGLATLTLNIPSSNAEISTDTNTLLHLAPFQLSARDDQTEDCLRAGDCRD
ncbi:MAG: hypothetical protein KME60_30645 [Cyanomargarita calcarea GSE-NOS-MK-12-04C]|jgi:hypothetical protein|uniref:Uncharacterized protein n=1 Tax=Cyanomargarita calcarea GSE-NOS-MK-12-04C TaxID=2839659 RepID=A0A951UVY4_9CYAN|nr:hypothetical protein [Cyanomargarita calcarea GSE-NOS-MK-12-04C]